MSESFSDHKQAIWRDRADFIINASLPEEGCFEQLWCRRLSEDTFEVCCIPFFVYDVALGDVVKTGATTDRSYLLSEVVSGSGRHVFRVHFDTSMHRHRDAVITELKALGALVEWSSSSLCAVDAPDAEHAQRVANALWTYETSGILEYETGRSA